MLPVWNGERFLAEAMDSVLRQTFCGFELIVVDDGSADRSAAIADEFARCDARVLVLRRAHDGIANALNAGVAAARGTYVARMDADDVASAMRLEKQVAFLDAHPNCVAVGSDVEVIDEEGEAIGIIRFPAVHREIVDAMFDGSTRSVAHPTVVMRKSAVLAAGGYRAEASPSEDLDLWVRLIELGELANVAEPLLRYRRHTGAIGIRDGLRQRLSGAAIVDAVRLRHGLRRLKVSFASNHSDAFASYHFECVRIALNSGNRAAARKHARATIRRSPQWSRPYAALAISALPEAAFAMVMRWYDRYRARRRPSTSAIT